MTRIKSLRSQLGWTQAHLGHQIGLSQAAVARLEAGAPESKPVKKLLDMLESGGASAISGDSNPDHSANQNPPSS